MRMALVAAFAGLMLGGAACTPSTASTQTPAKSPFPTPTPTATRAGGPTATASIDGPGEKIPDMSNRSHVNPGTSVQYSTVPPTSGSHYAQWATEGFYGPSELIADETITHNMEHSMIVISYNFKDAAKVDQLRKVLTDRASYPCYVVARYYSKIPENSIALTAWTRRDGPFFLAPEGISASIGTRINAFMDAYAGKNGIAPEWFSCDTALPAAQRTAIPTKAGSTPTPTPQVAFVHVHIAGSQFTPTPIQAPAGTPVQFAVVNGDATTHTFTIQQLGIDKEIPAGTAYNSEPQVFKEGRYSLICRIHSSMKVGVTVGNPPA